MLAKRPRRVLVNANSDILAAQKYCDGCWPPCGARQSYAPGWELPAEAGSGTLKRR
jgi:hypothetical protein